MKHLPCKNTTQNHMKQIFPNQRCFKIWITKLRRKKTITFDQQRWSLCPCFLHFLSTHLQNERWSDEALHVKVRQVGTAGIQEGEIVLHVGGAVPDGRHQLLDADSRLMHLHWGIKDHVIWEYLYEHAGINRDFVGIVWNKSTAE